ncbi:MAG: NUDIX domain-containing protein [Patescibacteria group bacterium]|jgi:8-oxo-dGTP pyrophosphatase MutT (NUDIX family)
MKYHKRAAVIIIKDNKILLMHRLKNDREYYTIPGGTLEDEETIEQTAIREIKEETGLDISLSELLWEYKDEYHHGYYFLAQNINGQVELGGEELDKNNPQNHYALEWIELKNIKNILLYPRQIAENIYKKFK